MAISGSFVFAGSFDVIQWRISDAEIVRRFLGGSSASIMAVATTDDYVFAGYSNGFIHQWQLSNGETVRFKSGNVFGFSKRRC
jgi:hypothetical protein